MTPLEIEVMLNSYCSREPHRNSHAPAVIEAYKFLQTNDLIKLGHNMFGGKYCWEATERGRALVKLLCNVTFPHQAWIDEQGRIIE